MKIVIAGASGNIGHATARILLEKGVKPIVVARNAAKVADLVARGAMHVAAGATDLVAIQQSCRDADALLWLTPPTYSEPSLARWYRDTGTIAATLVREQHIARVVHISAVGAGAAPQLGTVSYGGEVEQILAATGARVMNLRPGYFMQNFLLQLDAIRAGEVHMALPADHNIPWVSTNDIGAVAAQYLMDNQWDGQSSRNLLGPESLTPREATQIIAEVIGMPLIYHSLPPEAFGQMFANLGANRTVQREMTDLMRALGDPRGVYATVRTPEAWTPTTLKSFAAAAIKPML